MRRPMLSFYQAAGPGGGTGCVPSLVMMLWTTIVAAIATVAATSAANAGRDAFSRSGSWQKRLSSSGDLHQSQQQQQLPDDLREFHQQLPNLQVFSSQLMLRAPRGQRQYDVPQIECPPADDGMERFACPTPDRQGRYHCIDDHVLCDGFVDCPSAEDEDRHACMFYKTTKAHLDVLADALLRWARGR